MVTRLIVPVLLFAALAVASCGGTNDAPTNVGQTTATLNATVSCDGGNRKVYSDGPGEPCGYYLYTQVKGSSDPWTIRSSADNINDPVDSLALHVDVTGLKAGTTYVTGLCGKGDAVRTWQCPSSLIREFTTQQAGSTGDDTAVPAVPSGWTRVGAEGFAGQSGAFPSSFTQYPSGWKDTSKQGTYGCAGGSLVSGGIFGFKLAGGQVCAPVFKTQGGSGTLSNGMPAGMTEGRYSVRFRVRSGASSAHKIAWLLWPDSDVWADGEIDFPEVSQFPGEVKAFTHHPGANVATDQDAFGSGVSVGSDNAWHVATIERKAGSVKYLLDGQTVGTSTSGLPSKAMHWILQSETRVNSTSVPLASATTDIDIDWVTVDKPTSTPPPPKKCADGLDNDGDGKVDLADPGCSGSTDDDETDAPPPPPGGYTIAAVGDICNESGCGGTGGGTRTAATIRAMAPDEFFGLGDYQYQNDGAGGSTFKANYQAKFGDLTPLTTPVFGNTHDTENGGVPSGYILGYFNQFGSSHARGKISQGMWGYSFDIGNWHVVALNYTAGSSAVSGLQADLAAHPSQCLLAFDHAPVYGSPTSTHSSNEGAIFKSALVSAGADLILTGHQHMYERVVADGLTSITNGLGGEGHYSRTGTAAGSVAYNSSTFGVVKLTLGSASWATQFVPNQGESAFSDTASGSC